MIGQVLRLFRILDSSLPTAVPIWERCVFAQVSFIWKGQELMESSRARIMPHSLETPYTSQAMLLWETPEEHMVTHYDLIP